MPLSHDAVEPINEIEISYSINALQRKLLSHSVQSSSLRRIRIDQPALEKKLTANRANENTYLLGFFEYLKKWPVDQEIEAFTDHINQLIYLWLNAIREGAQVKYISQALQCVTVKSILLGKNAKQTDKLCLFMMDVLCETLQKHQLSTLNYVLNYDSNTQLPNTGNIVPNLENIVNQADADELIGIFSIHFQASKTKLIYSREITLELNRIIAEILRLNLAKDHQLYFAGDSQFDILLPKLSNLTQINVLSAKLARAFEHMLLLNHQSILVTPFIGCSYTIAGERAPGALYLDAKLALDGAISKQQPLVLYSDELDAQIKNQNSIETKVIEAFNSDNLTLYLQPIVNTRNSKCVGAEMLLRWSAKYGYNIYPSLTIEILNKVGKGKLFTRWLVNSACRYVSELLQHRLENFYLTVNLRAEDLHDSELPHLFSQAASLWKIDPKHIMLEITENGILEYNQSSTSVIEQLARLGFRFALDDFGTGFSSLSRLRSMPIDLIKIDQSFVQGITHSHDDFEIVQSISLLAKSLGKEVLAEGVEDEEALAIMKKLQIDKCQGFYFSKPLPFEEFIVWAKAH